MRKKEEKKRKEKEKTYTYVNTNIQTSINKHEHDSSLILIISVQVFSGIIIPSRITLSLSHPLPFYPLFHCFHMVHHARLTPNIEDIADTKFRKK